MIVMVSSHILFIVFQIDFLEARCLILKNIFVRRFPCKCKWFVMHDFAWRLLCLTFNFGYPFISSCGKLIFTL